MDAYCPKCGEPWDVSELHDVPGKSFEKAWKQFMKNGCEVFDSYHCEPACASDERLEEIRMVYEMSGHDVDGCVSDLTYLEW